LGEVQVGQRPGHLVHRVRKYIVGHLETRVSELVNGVVTPLIFPRFCGGNFILHQLTSRLGSPTKEEKRQNATWRRVFSRVDDPNIVIVDFILCLTPFLAAVNQVNVSNMG
jgi:hypothetical protein